jgi:hypothetical protein
MLDYYYYYYYFPLPPPPPHSCRTIAHTHLPVINIYTGSNFDDDFMEGIRCGRLKSTVSSERRIIREKRLDHPLISMLANQ